MSKQKHIQSLNICPTFSLKSEPMLQTVEQNGFDCAGVLKGVCVRRFTALCRTHRLSRYLSYLPCSSIKAQPLASHWPHSSIAGSVSTVHRASHCQGIVWNMASAFWVGPGEREKGTASYVQEKNDGTDCAEMADGGHWRCPRRGDIYAAVQG